MDISMDTNIHTGMVIVITITMAMAMENLNPENRLSEYFSIIV